MTRDELLKLLLKIPAEKEVVVKRSGSKRVMEILNVYKPISNLHGDTEHHIVVAWRDDQ